MSEKKLYQQKLQAQLDEWQADIDKLKARAKDESADAQIELHKQIDTLETQVADARAQLKQLSEAGDEAWTSLKAGMDASWAALKNGFKDAAEKFKRD